MYFLLLVTTALLLISLFCTSWPIKLYHHALLKKIAQELNTVPQKNGLLFANVYSEIIATYQGKDFKIRFIENSIDSLKANSGLEIRMNEASGVIMEFYRANRGKRVWGDYQHFVTGDKQIDSQWFILTTDPDQANQLWGRTQLMSFLKEFPQLDQILINHQEIIIQLKNYHPSKIALNVIHRIVSCFS